MMNNKLHKTRLELIRNNTIVNSLELGYGPEKEENFNISTNISLNCFPTLSIKSSDLELNSILMGFSKSDIIKFSVCRTKNEMFMTMFEGEFLKKDTKFEGGTPTKLSIDVQAIHSFFKLAMIELSATQEFLGKTFGDFVSNLVNHCNISCVVNIDHELSKVVLNGISHKTNAFRLFKEVCLLNDAIVYFNQENTVDIDFRSKSLEKWKSRKIATINSKDIISSQKTETI